MTARIDNIADHLYIVDTVARWHWHEWGHADPNGSLQAWAEGLRGRTNRGRIPETFIALDGDEPVGSITLLEHDMSTHPELTPWVAGVFVRPEWRGQGVGTLLVRHAVAEAARLGVERLYLYTHSAQPFYERLGWQWLADEFYEGQDVAIMAIDVADVRRETLSRNQKSTGCR